VAASSAAADAARQASESQRRERERLTDEAKSELSRIKARLFGIILGLSDEARTVNETIHFGMGTLGF
jgi:hypothetical protein